jgi:hypothetical protein
LYKQNGGLKLNGHQLLLGFPLRCLGRYCLIVYAHPEMVTQNVRHSLQTDALDLVRLTVQVSHVQITNRGLAPKPHLITGGCPADLVNQFATGIVVEPK